MEAVFLLRSEENDKARDQPFEPRQPYTYLHKDQRALLDLHMLALIRSSTRIDHRTMVSSGRAMSRTAKVDDFPRLSRTTQLGAQEHFVSHVASKSGINRRKVGSAGPSLTLVVSPLPSEPLKSNVRSGPEPLEDPPKINHMDASDRSRCGA